MSDSRVVDGLLLLVTAGVVGLTAQPVTRMLAEAWRLQTGFVRGTTMLVLSTVGATLADAIAFTTGLVVVWALLFVVDSSKKVQGGIFLVLGLPTFYFTLNRFGLWTITWTSVLPALVLGILAGLVTGLYQNRFEVERGVPRVREFPTAARGLYGLVAVAAIIGFLQLHIVAGVTASAVVDLFATGVLILLLAVFTAYRDDLTVTVVSPDETEEANVVGGIYQATREKFGAKALATDQEGRLLRARKLKIPAGEQAKEVGDDENEIYPQSKEELRPFTGSVGFRFRPPGLFSRTLEVVANQLSPAELTDEYLDTLAETYAERRTERNRDGERVTILEPTTPPLLVRARLGLSTFSRRYVPLLLPAPLQGLFRRSLTSTPHSVNRSVLEADVLLLLYPMDQRQPDGGQVAVTGRDAGSRGEVADDGELRSLLDVYQLLCTTRSSIGRNTELVATRTDQVLDEYLEQAPYADDDRVTDLSRYVRNHVLDTPCDVTAVYRVATDNGQHTRLEGAEHLVEELY